jgi:predicted AAA+ superfamily ATPase
MAYIQRELQAKLVETLKTTGKKGIILAGVVGCGKTTLVNEVLKQLVPEYQVFNFTGDDTLFRNSVHEDSTYIHKVIRSQTQGRALVFVDEVQKSEDIFDAVKYCFDKGDMSFIISGSNPDYLNTTAKKRLQRRADLLMLHPFSLAEILAYEGFIKMEDIGLFRGLLFTKENRVPGEKIALGLELNESTRKRISDIIGEYIVFGGLPLVYLAKSREEKLNEIKKVVERGFESLSVGNENISDAVKIELAKLNAQEFTYQGLFQKTGIRRRDIINATIDQLINHGYLLKKKPYLESGYRRSYLSVFSFVDPGIVTYLTGNLNTKGEMGRQIEGVIHARIDSIMKNYIQVKSSLFYFKPYTIDINDKVKFKSGEIDFIFKCGNNVCPIEAKLAECMDTIKTPLLKDFINGEKIPYGIVM